MTESETDPFLLTDEDDLASLQQQDEGKVWSVAQTKKNDDLPQIKIKTKTTEWPQPWIPSPSRSLHRRPRVAMEVILPTSSHPVCLPPPATAGGGGQGCRLPWWQRIHLLHNTILALFIVAVALILLLQQHSITELKQRECGGHEAAAAVPLQQQPEGEEQRQQLGGMEPRQLRSSGFVLYGSGRYPLPAGLDVTALASIQLCCSTHMGLLDCRRGSVRAIQDVETGEQYFLVRLERSVSSCVLSYAVVLLEEGSPPPPL